MDYSFWQKQTATKPLFPDIVWSKPEQRSQAGRLAIVGGNSHGFTAVAESYKDALRTGAGEVRALLPKNLKKLIPNNITDTCFAADNPSGGLGKDALPELIALSEWSSNVLLIGDAGRNSETAITYETFINQYAGQLTITRDAFDLLKNSYHTLVERPNTLLILSFAQLQQLMRSVYYPKIITFSTQLAQLVEVLHKFTVTYPLTIVVLHKETLIVAHDGNITTTPWNDPMRIWRGKTATTAGVYWLWNPKEPLQAVTASLLQ